MYIHENVRSLKSCNSFKRNRLVVSSYKFAGKVWNVHPMYLDGFQQMCRAHTTPRTNYCNLRTVG